jgi:Ca-activated chloride channel family protein
MKLLSLFSVLVLAASLAGAVESESPALGGTLDAVDSKGAPLGACPLEHTDVSAEISGFVGRVVVKQTFSNPFPDPIEAVYTFPMSERGAVDAMFIRTEGREIRGEIRRREEARRLYENARQAGQLAALLDEERRNIFTQSIANLMPGATVEIEIHYVETLAYEDGSFSWSFPMVVGPRFIPGSPTGRSGTGRLPDTTRVPDASRITPPVAPEGTRAGHDISLQVQIDAGVKIEALDSRLHEVDVERSDESHAHVRLKNQNEIPNRDFVLRYRVAGDRVKSGFLTHRKDGKGYATFILIPPRRVTPAQAAPKELVFVVDRSGSQSGLPLLKAKETMLWAIDHLNPNDTFQIVSFSNGVEQLFAQPQLATPATRQQAREYVRALEANGGTYMAEAVQKVCAQPAPSNRLRIVSFMTDGYVGNDYEVIDLVKRLRGESRWFPFGTGNSTNRFLLDQMARHGGGEVEYVLLNEDGEKIARRFYERIATPVLSDVRIEFQGLDVVDVLPQEASDLWAQRPLIVHARYARAGRGRVILRGYRGEELYEEALDVDLPGERAANAGIASIWARERVDELMARDLAALQSGQFPQVLQDEIVEVALAHSILTPFTSFIAVEDRVINGSGPPRTVTVPVELPHGVDRRGALGSGAMSQDAALPYSPGVAGRSLKSALYKGSTLSGRNAPAEPLPEREERVDRKFSRKSLARAREDALAPADLAKLGPHLRDLFEGRIPAIPYAYEPDGSLRVEVEIAKPSPGLLDALEKAGLDVRLATDRVVTGSIALDRLAELLAIPEVLRIELH